MTDSTNNKDPLEELFQQKSEEYDISYREEDWNALENRLDTVDAQRATRRWRGLAAAVVLIAFSVLAYVTFQNYQQINLLNEQLSQQEELIIPAPQNEGDMPNNDETNQQETPDTREQEKESELASVLSGENADTENETPDGDNDLTTSQGAQREVNRESIQNFSGGLEIAQARCSVCERSVPISGSKVPNATFASVDIPNNSAQRASTTPKEPRLAVDINAGGVQEHSPRASVGFVLGPDLSTVSAVSNFYNPGFKFGVTVDYNINRNWAVSFGAIRSNVRYKANGMEYQPPEDYWYSGIHASETIGECILLDIPVNLTYRFLHFDHSRMYASAGMSTYIMLNEDYRFSYDSNQQGLPQHWEEKTGTAHFMSNANFSLGYEMDIAQKLSLRAEPFLRVPLKEVGWGNVNLYSMGSLISLNYKIHNN